MKTITFYSYKGGVGRTLLVANFARYLSHCAKKVYVLDFDLEAPGLHFKFGLKQNENSVLKPIQRGLVDYLYSSIVLKDTPKSLVPYTKDVTNFSNEGGSILFMPAGNAPSYEYTQTLSKINWHSLFFKKKTPRGVSLFNTLKKRIERDFKPDYLLIDSRTGITEISATAVHLLADKLVCMFLSNPENLMGMRTIIQSVQKSNTMLDRKPTEIIPVVTRIPEMDEAEEESFTTEIRKFLLKKTNDNICEDTISSIYILRSEPDLQIEEELRFNTKKTLRESVLLRDYISFFFVLAPELQSNSSVGKLSRWLPKKKYIRVSRRKKEDFIAVKTRLCKRERPELKIVMPKYVTGNAFKFLVRQILKQLKYKNQFIIGFDRIPQEYVNWDQLALHMHEGLIDFCGEAYYLTESRQFLVDIVQFGHLSTFTCLIKKDSRMHKILIDNIDTYNLRNDKKGTIFQRRMKDVIGSVRNLEIGVFGDHAAASEANRYLSPFLISRRIQTKSNDQELLDWINYKSHNRMLILDHSDAGALIKKAHDSLYVTKEKELIFKYKKRIPVGFIYPAEDRQWRKEISNAFAKAIIKNLKKISWEKVSSDLKKSKIEAFTFNGLCENLFLDMTISEAIEWNNELLSKLKNFDN